MITTINTLLQPLEKIIRDFRRYLGYAILFLAFLSLFYLLDPRSVKDSGEQALLVLWIVLWIPIFARVLGLRVARELLPLRKELGILMGTLALIHGSRYVINDPSFVLTRDFWYFDGQINFLAFGFFALFLSLPLTLTSSNWAMRKLGKWWKRLHRLAYVIALFVVVHVVLYNWSVEFEFGPVLILVGYTIGKILEWRGFTFAPPPPPKVKKKGQKWICIPCGYIYDPEVGDIDGGIPAGTEFIDIPDDWSCPVCGVKKSDFTPYEEGTPIVSFPATVIEKNFLNPHTLELTIETDEVIKSLPGQFMTFFFEDAQGKLTRQYSIVVQNGRKYTFTIKLGEGGRGASVLRNIALQAKIRIGGIYGKFLLQETDNPKIFIATGTGLAPIYHMIRFLGNKHQKILYFSVATKEDLFYVEKLRSLENLELHIHVTREKVAGYEEGRVDADTISASGETEWYLCGNPQMVKDTTLKLQARGFDAIFSEEFS